MWIILFSAVDDFGIREQTDLVRAASPGETNGASHEEIETIKKKLYEDTLHSACRIAGLAGVLTSHGYMVRAHPPWLFVGNSTIPPLLVPSSHSLAVLTPPLTAPTPTLLPPHPFLLYPQPTKHRALSPKITIRNSLSKKTFLNEIASQSTPGLFSHDSCHLSHSRTFP